MIIKTKPAAVSTTTTPAKKATKKRSKLEDEDVDEDEEGEADQDDEEAEEVRSECSPHSLADGAERPLVFECLLYPSACFL